MYNKLKLGVLISGKGTNSEYIDKEIAAGRLDAQINSIILNDVNAGSALTRSNHIVDVIAPTQYKDISEVLHCRNVDLVILDEWTHLIRDPILTNFKNRIINTHPSLLPAFPGTEAPKQVLDYGCKVTGCTVHYVSEGRDTRSIILQESVRILSTDNENTLRNRIKNYEGRLLCKALQLFADGVL